MSNSNDWMRRSAAGALAIGSTSFNATNPEKLLVQAGTTTSVNLMQGHGKINSYLQLNKIGRASRRERGYNPVGTGTLKKKSVKYVDMRYNYNKNDSHSGRG